MQTEFVYNAHDERHVVNLVSWIETFIFIRGVIIQNETNEMM